MTLKSQYNMNANIQLKSQDVWALLTSSVTLRKLLSNQNLGILISEMETWQFVSKTGSQLTTPPGIHAPCNPLPHLPSAHLQPD